MDEQRRGTDPRLYQIAVLSSVLGYGLFRLAFDLAPSFLVVVMGTAQLTQWAGTRALALPRFDPRSALISSLSLCLLLRTDSLWVAALAAFLAIAMKLVVRVRGKHLFNPTGGALVVLLAVGAPMWVSPGQWGNVAFFGFLLAGLGGLVVHRAARSDVTWAFMACYGGLVFGRALWLGDPLAIPLHQLQSGALLLFTFFMISDPKTTPDARAGRIAFAALVALGAFLIQFTLFRTNGLLFSLFFCSLLVPLIDLLTPGERYEWRAPRRRRAPLAVATS